MEIRKVAVAAVASLVTIACASSSTPSSAPVTSAPASAANLAEERSIIGSENGVRVEAHVRGDTFTDAANVGVTYDIVNDRATPVAVADMIAISTYDPETRAVTLEIGSEVPGNELLPRLLVIPPGTRKSFSASAHVGIIRPAESHTALPPNALRVKVNFLGDTKPFEKLIGIPETAVHDPQLANELFPQWVERNEIVITNALPMHWMGSREDQHGADWGVPHALTGSRH